MATELPVPIKFQLPDGWQAADPDRIGSPGSAFVAIHPDSQQSDSLASITIDGLVRDSAATLVEAADESVGNVEQVARHVAVTQRSELGTSDAPGLGQVLRMSVEINATVRELFQCQVYLFMGEVVDGDRRQRAIVRLVLTCNQQQFTSLMDDFQQFVATVALDDAVTDEPG